MRRFVKSTFIALSALTLMVAGLMLAGCGSPKDSSSPPQTTVITSDGSLALDGGSVSVDPGSLSQLPAVPVAPSGVLAFGAAGQVNLIWAVVPGATSYNIYWSTASGVTPASGTRITTAGSPYLQTGLAVGTPYYYIVTAVNSAGEGPASVQVTAATSSSVSKQLALAWDPVAGATSYNLYWSTVPGVTPATGMKISSAGNSYVHTGLAAGTTYYYVVTAADSSSESSASAPASGTTSP